MIQATAPTVPMNHGWRINSFILYQVFPEAPRAPTILTSPLELPPPGEGLTPPNRIPAAEEKDSYKSKFKDTCILKSFVLRIVDDDDDDDDSDNV